MDIFSSVDKLGDRKMGKNWKDVSRKSVYKESGQVYGRVQKFINLKIANEDNNKGRIIYDCRNQVEYTLEQARELIDRGWAETKDEVLLRLLEESK